MLHVKPNFANITIHDDDDDIEIHSEMSSMFKLPSCLLACDDEIKYMKKKSHYLMKDTLFLNNTVKSLPL